MRPHGYTGRLGKRRKRLSEMSNKSKILVVDNELETCEVLKRTLEKEGYDVSIASDGLQACNKLNGENSN